MKQALDLITRHEGLRLKAYRCPAGVWTIGYGHTAGVLPGQSLPEAEALRLLIDDVAALRRQLSALCADAHVVLSPNREAALLSFAFNVGFKAFAGSTLWRKIVTDPDDPAIAAEFARWKFANGAVLPGLVKRRAEEAALYFRQ